MELKTRQRLVGTMLLLLFVAIVAPLLFRTPTEIRLALELDLPSQPELPSVLPEPAVSRALQQEAQQEIADAAAEVVEVADARAERELLAPADIVGEAVVPTGWGVQLASYEVQQSAQELAQRLRDKGYRAYIRPAEVDQRRVYRVFAGPELSRDAAEELQQQLASDGRFKLIGLVSPYGFE